MKIDFTDYRIIGLIVWIFLIITNIQIDIMSDGSRDGMDNVPYIFIKMKKKIIFLQNKLTKSQ